MPAKLVVWIDGRWRSLEELEEEGRNLKFAVLRNGVLNVLPRPPKASNVVAGAPLPYRKVKTKNNCKRTTTENGVPVLKAINGQQPLEELQSNYKISNAANAKAYKSFPKITTSNQNILNNATDNAAAKKYTDAMENLKISDDFQEKENIQNNAKKHSALKSDVSKANNLKISSDLEKGKIKEKVKKDKNLSSIQIREKLPDVDSSNESESSRQGQEGSGLVIELKEEVLEWIRKFLSKTTIFKVDINRFDKDDHYRLEMLYKLQPVVEVARWMPCLHHRLSPSLRSSSRTSSKKKSTSASAKSSGKVTKLARRRSPVKFRKSSVPRGREYSSLEDHAIVSWLSASRDRECAVNGNRVWRELEANHARLTGQERTWHSLRNRYLRYILPALSLLALSPSHAQRLRAAAATGAIKQRRKRRPSILHEPRVRAAHHPARVAPSMTLSDSDTDGVLHNKVRRPSLRLRKQNSPIRKTQAEQSKQKSEGSDADAVQLLSKRDIQSQAAKSESQSSSKRPQVDNSKKLQRDAVSDNAKASNVIRRSGMKRGSRSPLKRIQLEKHSNESKDSDSDEHPSMPKKSRSIVRDSEDTDTDGAPHELSRLRPRHLDISENSDDDKSYTPTSALKKKRRKLFNL